MSWSGCTARRSVKLAAARSLAERILADDPRRRLVVTANTTTGRAQARSWGLDRVTALLAPFDMVEATRRFSCGPRAGGTGCRRERDLAPSHGASATAGGSRCWSPAPGCRRGRRRAGRGFRIWRKPCWGRSIISPRRDAETETRLVALGLPRKVLGGRINLKAAVRMTPPDPAALAALAVALPRARTILAASTHPGEEEIVLAAFRKARECHADLKLILAPRHVDRGDQVATLIAQAGQAMVRRSSGVAPGPTSSVYLADTMGEMALWYAAAAVSFVGGSLVAKGGHTPFEPAQMGSAIVHGPHVENQRDAYSALKAARGSVEVDDAGSLTAAMLRLIGGPRGRARQWWLRAFRGAVAARLRWRDR